MPTLERPMEMYGYSKVHTCKEKSRLVLDSKTPENLNNAQVFSNIRYRKVDRGGCKLVISEALQESVPIHFGYALTRLYVSVIFMKPINSQRAVIKAKET